MSSLYGGLGRSPVLTLALACVGFLAVSSADATTLRIATYNINADGNSDGSGSLGTGLETVLEGLGNVKLSDNGTLQARPLDILAIQELSTSQAASQLQTIVSNLNSTYGAGTYKYDQTVDPTTGGQGGGPNGLIYNTNTVKVISASATALGGDSGNGAPRAPMQYVLQPVGYTSAANFYLDVSHMKSGTVSDDPTNPTRRNTEATNIANNTASLGSNAHVVSVGDFNITGDSSEQTYKTMRGQFHDPGNPAGNWTSSSQFVSLLSESATDVRYRDDIQFVTAAADNNSGVAGLQYDLGSLTVFGNGGSTSLDGHGVNSANNTGVFPDFSASYRTSVLNSLTTASDHLPVVADYDIVGLSSVPEPGSLGVLIVGGMLLIRRRFPHATRQGLPQLDTALDALRDLKSVNGH